MKTERKICKDVVDNEIVINSNNQEVSFNDASIKDDFVEEQVLDNDGSNCPYLPKD